MDDWQPIETAPRDGRELLLYVPHARVKITGGYYDASAECRCWIAGGYMRRSAPPTHWKPAPLPPRAENVRNIMRNHHHGKPIATAGENQP